MAAKAKEQNATYLIKKHGRARVLQIFYYFIGLPVFCFLVFYGSIPFMGKAEFAKTQYFGLLVALAVWVVLIIINILAALICKKKFVGRALIMVIFTLVIMIGGSVFFDFWMDKKIKGYREEYVRTVYDLNEKNEDGEYVNAIYHDGQLIYTADKDEDGNLVNIRYFSTIYKDLAIPTYARQASYYVPWSSGKKGFTVEFDEMVKRFMRVYNVGWTSNVKGSVNTDGVKYGAALEREDPDGNTYLEYWFGEKGNVYKPNGLYADGYIFSVEVANNILIRSTEIKNYYKAQGEDVEVLYKAALQEAQNSAEYQKELADHEDYYTTLAKYSITEDRLDDLISSLGASIADEGTIVGSLKTVLSLAGDALGSALGLADDQLNSIKDLLDNSVFRNLNLDQVVTIASSFAPSITKEALINLVAGFSNYQPSDVKPAMYFIKDPILREYAYAKYYGEVHGANIGSILLYDETDDSARIGCVTLSSKGYVASESAFSLNDSYVLKIQSKYIPMYYPIFAVRRYALLMGGIVAFLFVAMYHAKMRAFVTRKKLEFLAGGDK